MTFTKERLERFINNPLEHGLTRGEQMEMARQMLAGMEQEPVGEVVLGEYDDSGCHPDARVVCIAADGQADWENFKDGTLLYATPPTPVVPKELLSAMEEVLRISDRDHDAWHKAKAGIVSCRAAMLQDAEPVSQRDELPLDYLQGQKDGLEWAAQMAEANHPETGDWLYDDPLELAKAIRKGPDMPEAAGNSPAIPDGYALVPVEPTAEMIEATFAGEMELQSVQHQMRIRERRAHYYRAMLAAAPQQEVR